MGSGPDDVNAKGLRRPNGTPWRWHDLYRIGENPHYCGILAYDRWFRDEHDGTIKRKRPLNEQQLVPDNDCIPDPYVSEEIFWNVYKRRFNHQTRYARRSQNGTVSELTGLLYCPECGRVMSSLFGLSSKGPDMGIHDALLGKNMCGCGALVLRAECRPAGTASASGSTASARC